MTKHDFKGALEEVQNGLSLAKEINDIESVDLLTAIQTALKIADKLQSGEVSDEIRLEWRKGEPPKYLRDNWFIARSKNRDRAVLRALSDENYYDYTTSDGTYIKAENIESWMQFPDSPFVEPEYESRALKEKILAYEKAMSQQLIKECKDNE